MEEVEPGTAAKSGRFPALALSRSGSKGISHPPRDAAVATPDAGPPRKQRQRYTASPVAGKSKKTQKADPGGRLFNACSSVATRRPAWHSRRPMPAAGYFACSASRVTAWPPADMSSPAPATVLHAASPAQAVSRKRAMMRFMSVPCKRQVRKPTHSMSRAHALPTPVCGSGAALAGRSHRPSMRSRVWRFACQGWTTTPAGRRRGSHSCAPRRPYPVGR